MLAESLNAPVSSAVAELQNFHCKLMQAGVTLLEMEIPPLDLGKVVDQVLSDFSLFRSASHGRGNELEIGESDEIHSGLGWHEREVLSWVDVSEE